MADQTLNCNNLNCPMPIVQIGKTIKTLKTGNTIEVTATDPAFEADVRAWTKKTGHELVSFSDGEIKTALIEKK
ncbi:MAG: sulfurtransferase TusA family protein [SAR324 cluster bacterium]|nr:sulfurtransferase TusA family protein [SAR324 cluster bacterium]